MQCFRIHTFQGSRFMTQSDRPLLSLHSLSVAIESQTRPPFRRHVQRAALKEVCVLCCMAHDYENKLHWHCRACIQIKAWHAYTIAIYVHGCRKERRHRGPIRRGGELVYIGKVDVSFKFQNTNGNDTSLIYIQVTSL
jgi:hypothetical protein